MIDFKYHITTIIAIFLALAIGILFGVTISRQSGIHGLGERTVQKLSTEFKQVMTEDQQIRAKNTDLSAQLEKRDQFEKDILPSVVAGRLKGKKVALILAGDHGDAKYLHGVVRALESAGANVTSTSIVKDTLFPSDPSARNKLITQFAVQSNNPRELRRKLCHAIGKAIVMGDAPQGLKRAEQLTEGLSFDGDYSTPVNEAILISPASVNRIDLMEAGNCVEIGLIEGVHATGIRLIACETDGPYSVTSYLKRSGVTTVDSVDHAAGQVALVLALAGSDGSFGLKAGATQIIPTLTGSAK